MDKIRALFALRFGRSNNTVTQKRNLGGESQRVRRKRHRRAYEIHCTISNMSQAPLSPCSPLESRATAIQEEQKARLVPGYTGGAKLFLG